MTDERPPRRRRVGLTVLGLVAIWLIAGFIRAPSFAAAAFADFEAPRTTLAVQTSAFPIIPPFFVVPAQATVCERPDVCFVSAQFFLIEPFTGWAINLSHLGSAPSA